MSSRTLAPRHLLLLALAVVLAFALGGRRRGGGGGGVSLPHTATATIRLGNPPGLANPPAISFAASGAGNAKFYAPRRFTLPVGVIDASFQTTMITAGGGQPVRSLTILGSNGAGDFRAGQGLAGGFGGPMRLLADTIVHLKIGFGVGEFTIPLSAVGTNATFMGQRTGTNAVVMQTGMGGTFLHETSFTVEGKRWTTGMVTAMATNMVAGNNLTDTDMATGYDNRTTMGLGTVQLVTPIVLRTRLSGEQAGVTILRVTFQQAPSGAALGAGGLVLALAGLHRLRRARW